MSDYGIPILPEWIEFKIVRLTYDTKYLVHFHFATLDYSKEYGEVWKDVIYGMYNQFKNMGYVETENNIYDTRRLTKPA